MNIRNQRETCERAKTSSLHAKEILMTHSDPDAMNTWLQHIRVLAEDIGPRGSTTETERQAAGYCEQVLSGLGLEPRVEAFQSATTLFGFHLLNATAMLVSVLVYPMAGRIGAALALILSVICMSSLSLELLFKNNPIRRLLPRRLSRNVMATIPPSGEHKRDIILVGHVDTNHSSIIFRNPKTIYAWRVFSSICAVSFYLQIILYGIGLVTQAPILWPWLALPTAISAVIMIAFMVEGELAPFSKGANDNATGAGLVLTLGEQLANTPLQHSRVWLVCTGCEEVKHYGVIDFYRRHLDELVNPRAVVFEMLGRDNPGYLVRESTINLFTIHASPELVTLAASVAKQHPELHAHPTRAAGGHTEMADAIRFGVPAITIAGIAENATGYNYDGPNLYWHHKDDTLDNLIPDKLDRSYAYVWELVKTIDGQGSDGDKVAAAASVPGSIEPQVVFPATEGLMESRYPKSNRPEAQPVPAEQANHGKDA